MDYSINSKNINAAFGAKKMDEKEMSFQDRVDEMVSKTSDRAELEVPEYGDFAPVMEFMDNTNKDLPVGKYGIKIYKMPKDIVEDPKQRYIEAAVYMPAGDYKADMVVGSGHKDKILEILNSPEFPEKLNRAYGELLDVIEDQ